MASNSDIHVLMSLGMFVTGQIQRMSLDVHSVLMKTLALVVPKQSPLSDLILLPMTQKTSAYKCSKCSNHSNVQKYHKSISLQHFGFQFPQSSIELRCWKLRKNLWFQRWPRFSRYRNQSRKKSSSFSLSSKKLITYSTNKNLYDIL